MSEASFASLEPGLLARKGGAKPAMRPQLAPLIASADELLDEARLDDLGWNDMGGCEADGDLIVGIGEASQAFSNPVAPSEPLIRAKKAARSHPIFDPLTSANIVDIATRTARRAANEDYASMQRRDGKAEPVLLRPADQTAGDEAAEEASLLARKTQPQPGSRVSGATATPRGRGRRAAFTLRLEEDRHLKLKLAATIRGVSAQALLTEALDALLMQFHDLEDLANRIRPE